MSLETYQAMNNEDLHAIFSDWYKDVNGIRPRFATPNDREVILDWIAYELSPAMQEQRQKEAEAWEKDFQDRCREYEEECRAQLAIQQEQAELESAYDDTYFDLEASL